MADDHHDSFTEYVAGRLDAKLAAAGHSVRLNRNFVSTLLDEHVNDDCEDPKEAADSIGEAMTPDDMLLADAEFILRGLR